jgi:hypothetical protein
MQTAIDVYEQFNASNAAAAVGFYLVARRQGIPFILKEVAAILLLKESLLRRFLFRLHKETEIPKVNPKLKYRLLERFESQYTIPSAEVRAKIVDRLNSLTDVSNQSCGIVFSQALEEAGFEVDYKKIFDILGVTVKSQQE